MVKLYVIPISKQLIIGLLMLFLQVMANAQEETVIDNKGNIIQVRNTTVTTSTTAPTSPVLNDIWFDTTANLTKIYDGTTWLVINADALATKENAANKSTDVTLADATNTEFPTELAVKTYVEGRIATTADDDITDVSFDGTDLRVEEGSTSFSADLSGLRDSDWFQTSSTIPATTINQDIYTLGDVGIGIDNPQRGLHVASNDIVRFSRSANTAGMIIDRYSGTINNTLASATFGLNSSTVGEGEFFFANYNEAVSGAGFTRWITFDIDSNQVKFDQYGQNNYTGTVSKFLAVESDGNLIEVDPSSLSGGTNIYGTDGTLNSNRAVLQNNFDLNFDADTMVVSGDNDRVGIGTALPSSKLHVNESFGTAAGPNAGSIFIEHQNSGGTSSIVFKSTANVGSDYGYIQFTDDGSLNGSTTENALLEIGIQNDVAGTYQDDIAIMPSGYVGIGTRAPSAKLDIESTDVPLNITPNSTTPTGTQTGQIFMGTNGILYAYDDSRSKWLSVDRNEISWARNSSTTTNEYLRAHSSSSMNNGYRMIRDATITAVAAQTNTSGNWNLLILRNDETVSITFLTLSNETGRHANNVNIDINEGDFIQAYCLGMNVNHPLALIEFAWRK